MQKRKKKNEKEKENIKNNERKKQTLEICVCNQRNVKLHLEYAESNSSSRQ